MLAETISTPIIFRNSSQFQDLKMLSFSFFFAGGYLKIHFQTLWLLLPLFNPLSFTVILQDPPPL
ncbi:hypothetical protein LLG90_28055, partial [Aromatoleum toluclasticum]|uniref:hypothetical protein n=1 Tax=Aromatoleum toluclasticum TaxID=92003 RepID=UPI001D1937DD